MTAKQSTEVAVGTPSIKS